MKKGKWEAVPGGLAGPTYLKRKFVDDNLTLERWHHPQWSPALKALSNGNTKSIGKLLRAGSPVPEDVAKTLGIMLAPTPAYKGTRLQAQVPKKWTTKQRAQVLGERRLVRKELEAALKVANGKLESAIADVSVKREKQGKPHSRRYLMQCWKLSDAEIVFQIERFLGMTPP